MKGPPKSGVCGQRWSRNSGDATFLLLLWERGSAAPHPFSAQQPRTRGPEYALIRVAGAFFGDFRGGFGERAMSLGTILVIILIIFLLGGFSGRFGGYGYGRGHSTMGLAGVILVVLLILLLLGKI